MKNENEINYSPTVIVLTCIILILASVIVKFLVSFI